MEDGDYRSALPDPDEGETQEWRDSIISVEENFSPERARQLLQETVIAANEIGVPVGELTQTAYVNSIHPDDQPQYPGNLQMEQRIQDVIRWNAMMMVAWEQIFRGHWWTHFDLCEYIPPMGSWSESFLPRKGWIGQWRPCLLARSCKSWPLCTGLDGRTNG